MSTLPPSTGSQEIDFQEMIATHPNSILCKIGLHKKKWLRYGDLNVKKCTKCWKSFDAFSFPSIYA